MLNVLGVIIVLVFIAFVLYVLLSQPSDPPKPQTLPIIPVQPQTPTPVTPSVALQTSSDVVMESLKSGLKPVPNSKITITYCMYPEDLKIQPFAIQELNRYKLLLDIELIMVPDTIHYIKLKSTVHNIVLELTKDTLDIAYGTILCTLASYLPDPLSFVPFPNNPVMVLQFMLSDEIIKSEFGKMITNDWVKDASRNKYNPEFLILMIVRKSPLAVYITGKPYTPESIFVYYREVGSPADQLLITIPAEFLVTENTFEDYAKTNNGFGTFKYIVGKSNKYQLPQR